MELIILVSFSPLIYSMRWNLYFMQTDIWFLERRIYLAVGINISVASARVLAYSPG
jgi:hypothetical protein